MNCIKDIKKNMKIYRRLIENTLFLKKLLTISIILKKSNILSFLIYQIYEEIIFRRLKN